MSNKIKWWELEKKTSQKKLDYAKKYRDSVKNSPQRKEYFKKYRESHREELKEKHRLFRYEVLKLYSDGKNPFCLCCGESEIKFLALDHIKGGGTKHRKSLNTKGGNSFFFYLKKLDFPKDYQVLCHNCNMAKGIYEKCPHKN